MEAVYTYTIFDSDPAVAGPCAWPTHEDVEVTGTLEDVITEATDEAECDGEPGETLHVLVWDADGITPPRGAFTVEVPE